MKNITIIASESAEGFNYCTTEFNGEIEETGYTLFHYYDQTEKISRLTAGGNYRSYGLMIMKLKYMMIIVVRLKITMT